MVKSLQMHERIAIRAAPIAFAFGIATTILIIFIIRILFKFNIFTVKNMQTTATTICNASA